MKKIKHLSLICTLSLVTLVATAEQETFLTDDSGWVDMNGHKIPDASNIKSVNGFGAHLLVTPDRDWAAKWDTSHDTVPYFSEADRVQIGERLTILTFYINPMADATGNVLITCDLKVVRPDGTLSVKENGLECVAGELAGDPRSVRLSPFVLEYIGEPHDPLGKWSVEVVMTDEMRGAIASLKTSFELIGDEAD